MESWRALDVVKFEPPSSKLQKEKRDSLGEAAHAKEKEECLFFANSVPLVSKHKMKWIYFKSKKIFSPPHGCHPLRFQVIKDNLGFRNAGFVFPWCLFFSFDPSTRRFRFHNEKFPPILHICAWAEILTDQGRFIATENQQTERIRWVPQRGQALGEWQLLSKGKSKHTLFRSNENSRKRRTCQFSEIKDLTPSK